MISPSYRLDDALMAIIPIIVLMVVVGAYEKIFKKIKI